MLSAKRIALGAVSAIALVALISAALAETATPAPQAAPTPQTNPAQPQAAQPAPVAGAQANPTAPAASTATPPASQSNNRNSAQSDDTKPQYLPPGMIMGPAVMNAYAMERSCDPRASGFSGWRISRFERALELTDDQKAKFEDLKTASGKALDTMVSACSTKPTLTPTGQLELMEKRLTAQLEAVKTLRAAFDPFYATLTDEQKARLSASRGGAWRWETGDRGRW